MSSIIVLAFSAFSGRVGMHQGKLLFSKLSATSIWTNAPKQPEKAAISNPKERMLSDKTISVSLYEPNTQLTLWRGLCRPPLMEIVNGFQCKAG